jgi:hypothetical protein
MSGVLDAINIYGAISLLDAETMHKFVRGGFRAEIFFLHMGWMLDGIVQNPGIRQK